MVEKSKQKGHILLIDHDEAWLEFAQPALEAFGYVVKTARSTKEVLDLEDKVYDLIIMNWAQADQERLLLHRLARSESSNPRRVVVISPIQQLPERMRVVFKAGAYDCVDKPFDRRELVELIETLQAECVLPKDN